MPHPDPAAQTAAFMDALLGYAPDDHHALLWTLQDKRSTWVALTDGTAPVADRARALADGGKDVYVAVSLARQAGMYDTRIKSANAAGIMGLWADIDIADPDVHKKWNLPPSHDAAMELLTACGREPTLVVNSGHGLQAWWLFQEFWAFDSEDDRLAAAGLAQRWNTTLQVRAAERSWVVDSTFDLARVMRVPGTLNRKGSPVVPVKLLSGSGPRYNPEDFDAFCLDQSFLAGKVDSTEDYVPDDFVIDDTLQPRFERFQALMDNDPVFELTWKMKRKDLTDQSPSSYDMSLATQAARAQWTDKEIAGLLLHFRRTHKLDVSKAMRKDYIDRTLKAARKAVARFVAADEMEDVGQALDEARATGDDEAARAARRAALDNVGTQLGYKLVHAIKYVSDPPAYELSLPTAKVNLGGQDGVLRWDKMRGSMYDATNSLIPRFKPADWDAIVNLLGKAWEDTDVGSEATDRGEVASWLAQYIAARPPVDTLVEAATSEYPYFDDDRRVVMFGPAFRRWLYLTFQERVTNKDLGRRLRAFGCEPDKVNVEDAAGKRTSRGVWRLPVGVGT